MISDFQSGGGCNPLSRVNLAVQEYDWIIIANLRKETGSPLQDYFKMLRLVPLIKVTLSQYVESYLFTGWYPPLRLGCRFIRPIVSLAIF